MEEYGRRMANGRAMGGDSKLAQRLKTGLPNARELVELFSDRDSFMELGTLAGGIAWHDLPAAPADALVGGLARIGGRDIVLAVEDFSVQGGSIGHVTAAKRLRLARLAGQEGLPLVMVLDGAGARASNGMHRYPYAPNDMQELVKLSGKVPTVSVVVGSSAGHGAITAMLTDFVIMLEGAAIFSAGPPLVAAAMGEKVSREELGGAAMHTKVSGVAHNLVRDASDAAWLVRRYLSYLPQNAWQLPPEAPGNDAKSQPCRLEKIFSLLPRQLQVPYDIRPVLELLVDQDSLLEIQPLYGPAMVCALARLGGKAVAIVANQPAVKAGSIDRPAAEKATHFLELANAFHLPTLFLADNPGIMSGCHAEREGTLRSAARMYAVQASMTAPKLHVTLRKVFGFGSSLMAMNPFDQQTICLGLPTVSLGGLPMEGGAQAAGLDAESRRQLETTEHTAAWVSGDSLAYDEIIDPAELRIALIRALEISAQRRSRATTPVPGSGILP